MPRSLYQVHVRGYEPQPLYTNRRKALADAKVLAAQERRVVSVHAFAPEGAVFVARYEPEV